MMKKWGIFLFLSVLLVTAVLVCTNLSAIVGAIKRLPIDWVISYLLGATTMFVTQLLGTKSKNKPKA